MTIPELAALQRRALETVPHLSVDQRVDQLEMLHQTIQQWEDRVCVALRMDLGKSHEEAYMTEIGPVLSEISCFIRHLYRWSRPKRVLPPRFLLPGRCRIYREPYGLALILSPWHYPFRLAMIPFVGAMAAGNHCIIKPSAYAPATSQVIAELIGSCFPAEQAAVVLGGRNETEALLDERFDTIFFTGGVNAGRRVLEKAAKHVTPVTLELGGKSPCIVDETADIKAAARRIAFGKAVNAGQSCVAPDYLLVQEKVKEPLLATIRKCWLEWYGDPLFSPQWPKMLNARHYQRIMGLIQGHQVFCGGEGDGERIAPTILTDVSWDDPIMDEEIFGPVLPVLTFKTIEEAIYRVNSREKPLALYLFTRRFATRDKVLRQVSFGGGCVNDTLLHAASSRLPFGGVGQSGLGRYHGKYSFDTFTHEKPVVFRGNWPDGGFHYPPFDRRKLDKIRRYLR